MLDSYVVGNGEDRTDDVTSSLDDAGDAEAYPGDVTLDSDWWLGFGLANVDFGPEAIGGDVVELVPVYDARLELMVVRTLVPAIEDLNPKLHLIYFSILYLYLPFDVDATVEKIQVWESEH